MMVSAVAVSGMASALGHEAEHPALPLERWSEVGGRLLPGTHGILHSLRSSVGIGMTMVNCIAGMLTSIAAAAVAAGAVR